jgi:hypothetical protein
MSARVGLAGGIVLLALLLIAFFLWRGDGAAPRASREPGALPDAGGGKEERDEEAVAAGEWQDLVDALAAVDPRSREGLELAHRLKGFLGAHPEYRELALVALLSNDSEEGWRVAGLIARVCGRLADENLAVALAGLLPKLQVTRLRAAVVVALGRSRHGPEPTHAGWGDGWWHVAAPIVEEEVRRALLSRLRLLTETSMRDEEFRVLMPVLTFSQDHDPAIAAFFDELARSDWEEDRENGIYSLSRSERPEAREFLRDLFLSPDEQSSVVVGSAAWSMLRTGDARDALLVMERFERRDMDPEARHVLFGSLAELKTDDPVVRDRRNRIVADAAADSSDYRLQPRALAYLAKRVREDDNVEDAFAALRAIAADAAQLPASRVKAVECIGKLPARRAKLKGWFWELAASDDEETLVRIAALKSWVLCATPETKEEMIRSLEDLQVVSGGRLEREVDRLSVVLEMLPGGEPD